MKGDIQVVPPIVQLGDMGLAQGIIDGQWMETEDIAQDRLTGLDRLPFEVDPDGSLGGAQQARGELRRAQGPQGSLGWKLLGSDH